MASLKQKVKDIASEIKGQDENFEITLFQSGDELEIPPTDNFEGKSGGTGKANVIGQPQQGGSGGGDDTDIHGGEGGDEDPPDINLGPDGPDGPGGDGPEGPEGPGGDDGPEGPGGDDPQTRIKVGDRVRNKTTGGEGIVTAINDDGTYRVGSVPQMEDGGPIEEPIEDGVHLNELPA